MDVEEIIKLTSQVNSLEIKISTLESSLIVNKAFYESCDGNLDCATYNLQQAHENLKTCSQIEGRSFFENSTSENHDDFFIFVTIEGNRLTAVDLKISTPGVQVKPTEMQDFKHSTEFFIDKQQTLFLPTNLGENLPKLEILSVTYSGLYQIDGINLKQLKNLRVLNFTHNKIYEIPLDAFDGLDKLQTLDLSFNKLKHLESGTVLSLTSLKELRLEHNSLTSFNDELIAVLINLRILSLRDNKLKIISPDVLSPLTDLKIADFSNNVCINISYPESTFEEIRENIVDSCLTQIEIKCKDRETLTKVQESDKKLENICEVEELTLNYPKMRISGLNEVEVNDVEAFYVIDQHILFMPFKLAENFPKLDTIFVNHSGLSKLSKNDFESLDRLKFLTITFNNISTIDDRTFDSVPQIEYLNLASNNIQSLPEEIFMTLIQLQTLDLSDNLLKTLSTNVLPAYNDIESFYAQNNHIELINVAVIRRLREAKFINLSGNICIDAEYEMSEVNKRALFEFISEIGLNCSGED